MRFLKEHKLTWPQIFEAGGMDSRLAIDYRHHLAADHVPGRRRKGKCVNRNLRIAELEKQLEKLLPAKEPGVADLRQLTVPLIRSSGLREIEIPETRAEPSLVLESGILESGIGDGLARLDLFRPLCPAVASTLMDDRYSGVSGFLPGRASLMLDVVVVAMFFVLIALAFQHLFGQVPSKVPAP